MPKIDCFHIAGLHLWWWSDDHEPHHFHAERSGEWEIRVFFLVGDYEVKWGKPRGRLLRELLELATAHRAALLDEWEAKVN